jgi:cytochrome P450
MRPLGLPSPPQNVALRHPDDVARVCRDADAFNKGAGMHRIREWLGDSLVGTSDQELHDGMRELLNPAFMAAAVKGFAPDFAQVRARAGAGGAGEGSFWRAPPSVPRCGV